MCARKGKTTTKDRRVVLYTSGGMRKTLCGKRSKSDDDERRQVLPAWCDIYSAASQYVSAPVSHLRLQLHACWVCFSWKFALVGSIILDIGDNDVINFHFYFNDCWRYYVSEFLVSF